ncbi:hypothetical protein BASA81_001307 [Batrachochytrium salamandrivorans]|nr:hypothetical protein BASA81_001307 [Batrachochytrium salamandrivorans]
MDQDEFSRQVLCIVESELTEAFTSLSSQIKIKRSCKLAAMAHECQSQLAQDVASLKEMCSNGGVFPQPSNACRPSSLTQQIQLTLLEIQSVKRRTLSLVNMSSQLELFALAVVPTLSYSHHQQHRALTAIHREIIQTKLHVTCLASGLCPTAQQPTALRTLNQQLLLL